MPAIALAAAFMIVPGALGLFLPALGRAATGEVAPGLAAIHG